MSEKPIHNPHDKFFKKTFIQIDAARGYFENYLPKAIVKNLDFDSLAVEDGSFVSEQMRSFESDLLYRVNYANRPAFIYCLLEHQSQQEYWMSLRLLGYMVEIWRRFISQNPEARKLPVILPMVLAQDPDGWRLPQQFCDFFDVSDDPSKLLNAFIPDFRHELFDVTAARSDEIRGHPIGQVCLLAMKFVSENNPSGFFEKSEVHLVNLADCPNLKEALSDLLRYLSHHESRIDKESFCNKLLNIENRQIRENAMSVLEQILEEGLLLGKIQGIQKLQKLLNKEEASTDELKLKSEDELNRLYDSLEAEIRDRLNR